MTSEAGNRHPGHGPAVPAFMALMLLMIWAVSLAIFLLTSSTALGCDEPQTANIVQFSGSWSEMFKNILHDANSPLVYIILRLWSMVFGTADQSFKACVILIASLVPTAAYLGLYRRVGVRVAFEIALLTALCASFVHHAQLVRSYGLVVLLGLLATLQLQRLLEAPRDRVRGVIYALLMVAIPYAHLSGLVVWCGHAAVFAYKAGRGRLDKSALAAWLVGMTVAALAVLPIFLPPMSTPRENIGFQQILHRGVSPLVLLVILPRLALLAGDNANLPIAFGLAGALFWCSYIFLMRAESQAKTQWPQLDLDVWLGTLSGMILAEMVIASQMVRETYVVHFIVPMIVSIVLAVEVAAARLPARIACLFPFLLLLPLWLPQLFSMHSQRKFGVALAAEMINRQSAESNSPAYVVVSREWYGTGIARYLDARVPYICVLSMAPIKILDYLTVATRDPAPNIARVEQLMADNLNNHRTIYHLYGQPKSKQTSTDAEDGQFDRSQEQTSAAVEGWLSQHARLVKRTVLPDCAGPLAVSEYR